MTVMLTVELSHPADELMDPPSFSIASAICVADRLPAPRSSIAAVKSARPAASGGSSAAPALTVARMVTRPVPGRGATRTLIPFGRVAERGFGIAAVRGSDGWGAVSSGLNSDADSGFGAVVAT